jgi:hypothetical protein
MSIELRIGNPEAANSGRFFDEHRENLDAMADILHMPSKLADSLEMAIELTQPWTRGDHSRPEAAIALSQQQRAELQPLFAQFGLTSRQNLPKGDYAHILVPGAVQKGNNGRIGFVRDSFHAGTITSNDIVLLGGQRSVFGEVETALLQADLAAIKQAGTVDTWVDALGGDVNKLVWETDFMRLAAIKHLGALPLKELRLRTVDAVSASRGDAVQQYEFEWHDMPLRLLHTLATQRPNGKARHTTESCVKEWVGLAQPAEGARVGFVASNPHRERMAKSARRALASIGREDIQLIAAGPASASGIGDHIFLGEIARNLYEDKFVSKK